MHAFFYCIRPAVIPCSPAAIPARAVAPRARASRRRRKAPNPRPDASAAATLAPSRTTHTHTRAGLSPSSIHAAHMLHHTTTYPHRSSTASHTRTSVSVRAHPSIAVVGRRGRQVGRAATMGVYATGSARKPHNERSLQDRRQAGKAHVWATEGPEAPGAQGCRRAGLKQPGQKTNGGPISGCALGSAPCLTSR